MSVASAAPAGEVGSASGVGVRAGPPEGDCLVNNLSKFQVYRVAVDMVAALRPVVERVERRDRSMGDQMRRAANSVVLNLAEGNHKVGKGKRKFFCDAAGSAAEVEACLDLVKVWGFLDPAELESARELLDRVGAMLYRLTH